MRESLLTINEHPLFRVQSCSCNDQLSFNINHPAYAQLGRIDTLIRWWFGDSLNERVDDKGHRWLTINTLGIGDDAFSSTQLDWAANYSESAESASDEEINDFRILRGYLDFFMTMPARWASISCHIHSIPPLRKLPENEIEITDKHHSDVWRNLAADVHMMKLNNEQCASDALTFVNEMLTSRDFLDSGYSIAGDVKFKFLLDIDEFRNLIHLPPSSLQGKLSNIPAVVQLYLIYQPEKFRVNICDVGVGISQVVPVLFGCWLAMRRYNNVHIQQPELHLHPKLQAQLADVFVKSINASKNCGTFLLESHSEHLLLRLLRRIRETNQTANLTSGVVNIGLMRNRSLTSEQVSVVYVMKDEFGLTKMKHLRLADDGEFIDRWPDGFFTDRDIELFGDGRPFA